MIRFSRKPVEPEVSPTSPAVLLAKSLTDPETRDEWERTSNTAMIGAFSTTYHNKGRDLKVTRVVMASLYSGGVHVSTPFTLSDAERLVVREALRTFDKHLSDERERAALARLVAPKKAKGK